MERLKRGYGLWKLGFDPFVTCFLKRLVVSVMRME